MAQPTNTVDNSNDVEKDDTGLSSFPLALLVLVVSPLTVISAITTYLIFAWGKIRLSVILLFGLVPYLILMLFFWQYAIAYFIVSWTETLPSIISQEIPLGSGIFTFIIQQGLVSIPLGMIIGLGYSTYRWQTRPVWVETKFRLTPWEWLRKRKNIKDIQSDRNPVYDGMTLGVEENGNRVVQTYEESRAHTLIFGASGAGKTVTLLARLRGAIRNGQGALIVDLKGGDELAKETAKIAARYGKTIQHWSFHPQSQTYTGPGTNGPAYYDPIGRGEATRRKDLLIESRTWTEEYYKNEASNYLQLVMSVIVANPNKQLSTIADVLDLLNPVKLQERAIPLGVNPHHAQIVKEIDHINDEKMEAGTKSAIGGLKSQLSLLLNSIAGPFLQLDPNGSNNIDLFRAAHNGEIIVFSLDSSNYPQQAALIANLIIQDLKTVSSELRQNPIEKPFQIIIDEFSAVGSENIIGLVNKSRDANMPVTLTTQALGDLRKASPTLQDQLLGVVNSFIIHRANTIDDAEELAGLGGKSLRKRFNESVVYKTGFMSKGSAVGKGSIEDVMDFDIDPTNIQRLATGEFFYINKNPMRIVKGKCIMEDPSKVSSIRTDSSNSKNTSFSSTIVTENSSSSSSNSTQKNTVNSSVTEPVNAGQIVFAPQKDLPLTEQPLRTSNSPLSTPNVGVTKSADRDRLKQIMNQDPDVFLPREVKKDTFETKVMPPTVAAELPKLPKLPPLKTGSGNSSPVLPSIPKKPSLPTKPVSKTVPVTAPTLPTLPALPPLPGLPTKPVSPLNKKPVELPKPFSSKTQNGGTKDEFDF